MIRNLRQYGVGTDPNVDASTHLQSVFDKADHDEITVTHGVTVGIRRGSILRNKPGVTLRDIRFKILGEPVRKFPRVAQHQAASLIFENCDGLRLDNVEIDCGGHATSPIGIEGCERPEVTRLSIRNVGSVYAAFWAVANVGGRYERITVIDTADACRGIMTGGWNAGELERDATIADCYVRNTGGTGIAPQGVGVRIVGNTCIGMRDGAGIIAAPRGVDPAVRMSIYIAGNTVRDIKLGHGIQSDSPNDDLLIENVVVTGNTLENIAGSGIYVVRARNWTVSDNVVLNARTGVAIAHIAENVVVQGNQLHGSKEQGIHVVGNFPERTRCIVVKENVVTGSGQNGIFGTIYPPGTVLRGLIVRDNVCNDNGGYGVNVWNGAEMVERDVNGNMGYGNNKRGLVAP